MRLDRSRTCFVAAGFCTAAFAVPAAANDVASYFAGKTISVYVAAGGHGSYTLPAHMTADYLSRHLPGNPKAIAQFMPGAGGAKAANYLYNAAPKDGTAIGMLLKYVATEQATGRSSVRYDVRKFNWLISLAPINSVVAIWHKAPATTIEDARKIELVMGSTGKSSETYITPTLMNAFFGTRFRVVTGYKSTGAIHIAMEQGEVHGRAASWESLAGDRPQWLEKKEVLVLAHSGVYRDSEFPEIPTLAELAPNAEAKAIFEFVGIGSTLGRIVVAPPDVAQPRVAALRATLEKMVKDPGFLADAKSRKINIAPRFAPEVESLVLRTVNASPEIIRKTEDALR